ncbi:endonuclease domain-containing 1 protein-like [Spea bombifrons]|uniref:endonuclease domain-containing 1 protein-like n=1 Tax=Spea bombifrons TaxID=233779 RepID=UPI00234B78A2|nr:endonuclease domain-containing 1 protein-like [Spea bombifrons]
MATWLILALAAVTTAWAKVSPNFSDCRGQFYAGSPPQGFESLSSQSNVIAPICQMYETYNNPFFASLYHKGNRVPLYSAYILDFRPGDVTGEDLTFRLEPQLVDTRLPQQITLQPATETAIRNLGLPGVPGDLIRQNQAVNSDYTGSNYHKGHLNPNADHPDGPGQEVTYTLTNVAPMYGSLNSGAWRSNEAKVRSIAATCGKMYVVTGTVPGNNWISLNGVKRINIPSHVWSAFCCLDNNNRPIRAEGSLAPNNANTVQAGLSISSLQSQLRSLLGVSVTLFQNNCV